MESSLSAGYIAVKGGLRVGLCGTAIMKEDRLCGVRRLSSVSIRIPHEAQSCAEAEAEALEKANFPSTLIISPPGYGKTTCMRYLIRRASDCGFRVSVADERGELAAVWEGQAQFNVGRQEGAGRGGRREGQVHAGRRQDSRGGFASHDGLPSRSGRRVPGHGESGSRQHCLRGVEAAI